MAERWIVQMAPQRGFHFGVRGVGVEASTVTGASDTLFGALCQGLLAVVGLDDPTWGLRRLLTLCRDGDPPFLLSSLFPYAGPVRLLPRPLGPLPPAAQRATGGGKAWNKAPYLSWGCFAQVFGTSNNTPPAELFHEENLLQERQAWVTPQERVALSPFTDLEDPDAPIRLWTHSDSPRVTVDRQTSRSTVYQAGWVAFPAGAGLYSIIVWRDPAWQPILRAVLDTLADEGIGGERSAGYGQFTGHIETVPDSAWPGYTGTDAAMLTLSLVHPTQDEAKQLAQGWYSLTTRRGWVGTPGAMGVRRADVVMLTEGTVLSVPSGVLFGGMVDVTPATWPEHVPRLSEPLVRWGYALPLAVPLAQEELADAAC